MPGRNEVCPCGSGRKYKHCCAQDNRSAAIENSRAQAQFRRGLKLERDGHIEEAVNVYKVAATFTATASEANSRLGHMLLASGRAGEAADALRLAATADPDSAERRLDLARALLIEKKNVEAEVEVRRVLLADPRSSDGYWLLGRTLAEGGRFAEARAALEQAVSLNPRQGGAYFDLTNSYTLTEADRPLIAQMLAASRSVAETDQRIRVHFALGKAFDDLKDYGSAMQHFATANRLKKAMCKLDREALAGRIDGAIERFTPAYLASHSEDGDNSRLPVLVLGMPRTGSTLVEQIISSHADVAGAGELQFWPELERALERLSPIARIADFQRVAAKDCIAVLRSIAPAASRVVDKNPFNFLRVGLIHLVFPRSVIIHCRRNPIDTCLSIHSTYFRTSPEFSTDQEDLVFYYNQYLRLMGHWRAALPAGRMIDVDYEELVANPEAMSRRLVAACGLPWDDACLRPERNERVVRTASKWQARQTITQASAGRWRRYEPWIGPLLELERAAGPGL
ncbi:MAG TPA: sulfotransferase [Caulobacteraceae bacterium]|nr:sulfotransferase [Caulobacteraceae bacterium]